MEGNNLLGEMYREVVIRIKPSPHSWIMNLGINDYAQVRILECRPLDEENVNECFEIKCNPKHLDEIKRNIFRSNYLNNVELLDEDRKNGILRGIIRTSYCTVCRLLSSSPECFMGSAVYDINNGIIRWRLIANIYTLAEIIDKLRDAGVEIEIESVSRVRRGSDRESMLTIKQEEILRMAYKMGLFDFPRRITLNEFAKMVGLSPTTVTEILRTGLRKVLNEYFKGRNNQL